jgi:hypothetical protein
MIRLSSGTDYSFEALKPGTSRLKARRLFVTIGAIKRYCNVKIVSESHPTYKEIRPSAFVI